MQHHPHKTADGEVLVYNHVPGSEACVVAQDLRRQLAKKGKKIKRLRADAIYFKNESEFLSVEMTKINNVVQPLWAELRAMREDAGRDPQTGAATKAEKA